MTEQLNTMTEPVYIRCTRCHMKFIDDTNSINENFGYNRLKIRYQTCVRCRRYADNKESVNEKIKCDVCDSTVSKSHLSEHRKTKKCTTSINNNSGDNTPENGKIRCEMCKAIVSKSHLSEHRKTKKCTTSINNSGDNTPVPNSVEPLEIKNEPKEKTVRPFIQCTICNKMVKDMERHTKGNRCLKLDKIPEDKYETCNICGLKALKSGMDLHKLTVGCLKQYFTNITERPFNLGDQYRWDYLQKKCKSKN